jgi:hypothetical protein
MYPVINKVVFNPEDKEHRKWAAIFFKNKSWFGCPVRFVVSDSGVALNVIQRQLVEYYTNHEFKTN